MSRSEYKKSSGIADISYCFTISHFYLPPLVSNSTCLFTHYQPLYTSCCTALLYFSRYWTSRLTIFYFYVFFFLIYSLCEKYYKCISVKYYITNCVSRVTRLTLWTDEQIKLILEQNSFMCRELTVLHRQVKIVVILYKCLYFIFF